MENYVQSGKRERNIVNLAQETRTRARKGPEKGRIYKTHQQIPSNAHIVKSTLNPYGVSLNCILEMYLINRGQKSIPM